MTRDCRSCGAKNVLERNGRITAHTRVIKDSGVHTLPPPRSLLDGLFRTADHAAAQHAEICEGP